jgi:peptidoglycan/LPS O-acetylase OafA/YrhL
VDRSPRPATRVAAVVLVLVGLANAGLAATSLASDAIRMSPGAAGSLLVLGLLTAVAGALVWSGSRLALLLALLVFVALLVAQVVEVSVSGVGTAGGRLAVLGVLVAALLAAWSQERRRA